MFCGLGALLLLCPALVSGQETRPDRRFQLGVHSFGASRASWTVGSENGGPTELGFVETLRRHGEFSRYKETPAAGLNLYHYSAGLRFELPVLDRSRWDLVADLGVGATRLRSAKYGDYVASEARVSETMVSLLGGLSVQYAISDDCKFFVGARRLLYLDEDNGPAVAGLQDADHVLESGSWAFPLTLGLSLEFR